MAVRALGILGDASVVPELVHLTYHYNMNTRFWAQISLVRLTGENFGRDVAAWKAWWEKQGGKPSISEEPVAWATSPETLEWADPNKQDELDRQFAGRYASDHAATLATIQTLPKTGDLSADAQFMEKPVLELPPDNLRFIEDGSDDDAVVLLSQVIKANAPWIKPRPVEASYSLFRENAAEKQKIGPFTIQKGCRPAVRVGSIVWTPLHSMASKGAGYTLHMVGKSEWKGKALVAIDVLFDPPIRGEVGLGGQVGTSYSHSNYSTTKARITIEPTRAIPLFIECWTDVLPGMDRRFHCVWAFNPDFFEIDGGFAPKMFDWEESTIFSERQEFQVVDGVWIFKRGDAWLGAENSSGKSGHIQRLELVDLQIAKEREDPPPMTPKPSGSDSPKG